jgi:ATP-dependent exoDNAse (exonuclease V) beta subunit
LFESWNHSAGLELELEAQRERLGTYLSQTLQEQALEGAIARSEAIFQRLRMGQILRRFSRLGANIVAREMPLLLSRNQHPAESDVPHQTISGIIDLLYQDENAQHLTVVDFKTDIVESEVALQQRSAVYADQLRIYADALSRVLTLRNPPHLELWYLWADRVWPVPLD